MSLQVAPDAFLQLNSLQTKEVVIVVDIDGADYLTSRTLYQRLRYGDPVNYGDSGLYYGGVRPVGLNADERAQRSLLMLDGASITISQRLEPEQGRASISTLSMSFVDQDQYMTRLVSPGVIVDEILGREVKIWLGYTSNSFPEEFYVVWRGRVSQVNIDPGRVTLQFSDPNLGRKQQIFYSAKTTLSAALDAAQTTVNVTANGDFHKKIAGPDGTYDPAVKLYLKIEDEFIEYQPTGHEASGFGTNVFTNCVRGARGTTPQAHAIGKDVQCYVELADTAIDMALKIMLSGWNGFYKQEVPIEGFGETGDDTIGVVPTGIMLPLGTDAIRDHGLSAGDYIYISGSETPANNGYCRVTDFMDAQGRPNQVIVTNKTFQIEIFTDAEMKLRSQYDVYPTSMGSKLMPTEVDVGGHIYLRDTFLASGENRYRFLISEPTTAKEFIEGEVYLPIGAYALTRQGKLSVGYTKPPIADQRTVTLDSSNIIDPQNIRPQRGLNNRKFFNEIQWNWDFTDQGDTTSTLRQLDTESLSLIRVSSVLPITSKGSRSDLGFLNVVNKRSSFLLSRYARGAIQYTFKVFFGVGNQIEVGDVVLFKDQGELQITNMSTGERDLGVSLMEVIDRQLDIKSGNVQLTLQGGLGVGLTDRYATIAPSSRVAPGSTTARIRIADSYGEVFPGREFKKWSDYVGQNVTLHDPSYSLTETVRFLGFATDDDHAMLVDPPLSVAPPEGYIVDLTAYPTTTDAQDQAASKLVHAYVSRTGTVLSGISIVGFNMALADIACISVGSVIVVHSQDWTLNSGEVVVTSIIGTGVAVGSDMGFTPTAGMKVEFLRFADGGEPYRLV